MLRNSNILQSVENALRLIDTLAEFEELGVAQLSRELALGKSTVFRLLATLESMGYVKKNEDNSKYRLSMKFAYLGTVVLNRQEIVKHSRPYIEELVEQLNETVHLAVLEEDFNVRFVDKVKGSFMVHMESFIGGTKPAHCTGTGKAMLAHLSKEKVNKFLEIASFEQLTENTIINKDDLIEEFKKIRVNGYAIDAEESEIGLTCYAVPIFNYFEEPIAALSVSGPTSRMEKNRDNIIKQIQETSKRITESFKG